MESVRQKAREDIDRYGQSVICILADPDDDMLTVPFAYTIGNALVGRPELLLVGRFGPN